MTDAQWDIMDALWTAGSASASDLTTALKERRGWAYSTVKTQLDRMGKAGMVHAEKQGGVWTYSAVLSRECARRSAWERFRDVVFGGSAAPALAFAAQEEDLSDAERQALLELIDAGEEPT
ncbi:MAG: BlaI family penicillinase repressor [Cognaticolwellia sp.]|jgi:BlaI family penicillinase repressor